MRKWKFLRWMLIVTLSLGVSTALAQSGSGYDLSWNTVDGGGGTVSSGAYSLSGTLGQADAASLGAGAYSLTGGFWGGFAGSSLYLPVLRR